MMLRQLRPAILMVLVFVVLTGLVYPAAVTGIAHAAFRHQAEGSLIEHGGRVVGSELIGQRFTSPRYCHPRPSAAGDGYDAANSGATNLGPTNPKLAADVTRLAEAYRRDNGLASDALVPADAVTRSASGLDPDISPANATLQADRVAKSRSMSRDAVIAVINRHTRGRTLGLLGEPRVNVLEANMDLDARETGR